MTSTHDYLMFFTNSGKAYKMKAFEIPEASRTARGVPAINFLNLMQRERITSLIPVRNFEEDKYLVMVKPPVSVSTGQAYSRVKPRPSVFCCKNIVRESIERWKELLVNDFEQSVFSQLPILSDVKSALYAHGAEYVQMSGSGSTVFAIFGSK